MLDFFLSQDIKLKSHLRSENVKVLPAVTQRYNGRHGVTLRNL